MYESRLRFSFSLRFVAYLFGSILELFCMKIVIMYCPHHHANVRLYFAKTSRVVEN